MKTKPWAFAVVLLCTLLTSAGQIFLKSGVNKILTFNIASIITNQHLILGLLFYAVGAVLLIMGLRGGELSVLYPLIATSFIWVSIASPYFFPTDSMNPWKWAGVLLIVGGVASMGVAGRK